MSRRTRIVKGTSLLTLTEIVSRFFPILIIRQTKSALGLDEFGDAQVLMSIVDILMQLIGPGYGTLAALEVAKNPDDSNHISRVASVTLFIRALHGLIILLLVTPIAIHLSAANPAALLGLTILGFACIVDMEFLHASLQKMTGLSLLILASKIVGFIAMLVFINDPTDKLLYCSLMIGTNSAISIGTYLYHASAFRLTIPKFVEIKDHFVKALTFNLGLIASGLLERIDLVLVKHSFSAFEAGVYAIPLKLTQSILPLLLSVSRVFFSEMLTKDADDGLITRIVRLECLLALGVFLPMALGGLWTAPYVLDIIFAIDQPSYGPLLAALSLSAGASCFLHIFGYQILWRAGEHRIVTKITLLVLLTSVVVAAFPSSRLGILHIPVVITVCKVAGALWLAVLAKRHLLRLPLRELSVTAGISFVMAAVVAQISEPLYAVLGGGLVYAALQGLYYKLDPIHPLKT